MPPRLHWAAPAALALLASGAAAATEPQPAPSLELETVLDGPGPPELDWAALAGQAVVIEFWATWCGPCVGVLPHWNELVDEFAGEPVRFLSISDEDEAVVRRFLERREIRGWLALDDDRSVFDGFGVHSIPQTALVDADGRLRAMTHPDSLTAAAVRQLLAGQTPDVPPVKDFEETLAVRLDSAGQPEPLFRVLIRPSTAEGGMTAISPGRYVASALPLPVALRNAYRTTRARLVLDCELPETRYEFVFETAGDDELLRQLLPRALESTFGLVMSVEARQVETLVVEADPARQPALQPHEEGSDQRGSIRPGILLLKAATLADLAEMLEFNLELPVIDATGIEGTYDFDLSWDPEDEDGLQPAFEAATGLRLRPAVQPVEMVVVRCADEDGATGK